MAALAVAQSHANAPSGSRLRSFTSSLKRRVDWDSSPALISRRLAGSRKGVTFRGSPPQICVWHQDLSPLSITATRFPRRLLGRQLPAFLRPGYGRHFSAVFGRSRFERRRLVVIVKEQGMDRNAIFGNRDRAFPGCFWRSLGDRLPECRSRRPGQGLPITQLTAEVNAHGLLR